MPVSRVTARWSGFRGAPGYSNFFFAGTSLLPEDAQLAAEAVRTFFSTMNTRFPNGLTIEVQPTVDVIDEASGQITSQIDIEEVLPVTGGSTQSYSASSGAVVNWLTNDYRGGRRIRGKTFLVPLSTSTYDSNGDLSNDALTDIRAAATGLASGQGPTELVVWSRPINGAGGQTASVTASNVPDMPAVLRSRRD